MDTTGYYLPKDAQALVGVSASTLRNYTRDFERWLTTEATTTPRRFSADDLKLFAFIRYRTAEKLDTIEKVQAALDAGELDAFDWQPPAMATTATEGVEDTGGALVPLESLRLAQSLLVEAQRREADAAGENAELRARIEALQKDLGRAEGELAAVKAGRYRAPRWWRAVFGGRED